MSRQGILTYSLLLTAVTVNGFVPGANRPAFSTRLASTTATEEEQVTQHQQDSMAVRAPLKSIGPYPSLGLHFPHLATSAQRKRNETGISLDFVLDTAANVNTINAQVAEELKLDVVGQALPGVATAGKLEGGETFMLGDCQLEGLPELLEDEPFTFMTDLTASALPIASPASAGLLSCAFLNCFQGGVEFAWGAADESGKITVPPSVTFLGDDANLEKVTKDMTRVPIQPLPVTQLPSVMVKINGVEMPALLDTGSPITVLNAQAAKTAGIETIQVTQPHQEESSNPFANMANKFKNSQAAAQAAARGDVLALAGANGERVELLKTAEKADVAIGDVSCGKGNIYVGDLPGLAALNGLGVDAAPAVVLGMDVLRTRPKMLYRSNEVYFS